MISVTVDLNCIIELEEKRKEGVPTPIEALIAMHEEHKINLRVPASIGAENKPGGGHASSFSELTRRLAAQGLSTAEILKTPNLRLGMAYLGQSLLGGPEVENVERQIHEILYADDPFPYREFCVKHGVDPSSAEVDRKFRNRRSDVRAVLCHIWYGGGIFVTRDSNFHKKKSALAQLGAGEILTPEEAVVRLSSGMEP